MGLLSWLVTAGRDTKRQVFFVWLITWAIGICHLHHAVVGSVEVLAALSAGTVTLPDYGRFLACVVVGNIVGGVFFVAVLRYSHVVRGGNDPETVSVDDLPDD